MKAGDVICPGPVPDENNEPVPCTSHEIHFDRPIWKDREYEDVVIPCRCDTCGHMFEAFGHVVITKVE